MDFDYSDVSAIDLDQYADREYAAGHDGEMLSFDPED